MKHTKYILMIMFFFPNIAFAYLAAFAGYDLKECLYYNFESYVKPSHLGPTLEQAVHGYITKAQNKGDSKYFKVTYQVKDKVWTFTGDSNFPLTGSSFKIVNEGFKCVKGCSNHGVEYFFETSDEGENAEMWKFIEKYKLKVKEHCPALRI